MARLWHICGKCQNNNVKAKREITAIVITLAGSGVLFTAVAIALAVVSASDLFILQRTIIALAILNWVLVGICLATFWYQVAPWLVLLERAQSSFAKFTGRESIISLQEFLTAEEQTRLLIEDLHWQLTKAHQSNLIGSHLFDSLSEVVCAVDQGGVIRSVYGDLWHHWGYKPDELIGRLMIEFVSEEQVASFVSALKGAVSSRTPRVVESRLRRKDGLLLVIEWHLNYSPTLDLLSVVAHDITSRKQAEMMLLNSEAQVRTILESVSIGIAVCDQSGVVELANPELAKIMQHSLESLVGRHLTELIHSSELKAFLLARPSSGPVLAINDLTHATPVEVTCTTFGQPAGKFVVVVKDISERAKMDAIKREFLAMVSHDVRTPLAAINGFLSMLGDGVYGDIQMPVRDKTARARDNLERVIALLNNLLDLDKLESGKFEFNFAPVRIDELAERAVSIMQGYEPDRAVSLRCNVPAIIINADEDRLLQLLINLISNALKHSPRNSEVLVQAIDADSHLELSVCDSGRGIPEEQRATVFDRYIQIGARSERKEGVGLGLAICKAIVEGHHGSISVRPNPSGTGSLFWIFIPKNANHVDATC